RLVALSQRHRSEIYNVWAPQLGEEVAEALISHFPSRDLDEPVTKEFVEVKVSELRSELHQGFGEIRDEMHKGFTELRRDFDSRMQQMTLWLAGMVVALAGVGVSIALAFG
ncbi:MAG TPA: hypothetical protein VK611_21795, partial [Acidimicrobiales bacterium]|nr:hypothetical protein [Acidimicrobiales bacterium]